MRKFRFKIFIMCNINFNLKINFLIVTTCQRVFMAKIFLFLLFLWVMITIASADHPSEECVRKCNEQVVQCYSLA